MGAASRTAKARTRNKESDHVNICFLARYYLLVFSYIVQKCSGSLKYTYQNRLTETVARPRPQAAH
jgi:hypothetical protein